MTDPAVTEQGATTSANPFNLPGRLGASRHIQRAAAAYAVYQVGKPVFRKAKDWYTTRHAFIVTLPGTDEVYAEMHNWVLSQIKEDSRRALIASTEAPGLKGIEASIDDGASRRQGRIAPKVVVRYDGEVVHKLTVSGHEVLVWVTKEKPDPGEVIHGHWSFALYALKFRAKTPEGRDAVIAKIEEVAGSLATEPGPPPLMMANRYGTSWTRRNDLPPRPIDSVILKTGQLEHLVADLDAFLKAESEYNRLCLPWHRGYMFSGPPGTGKSSVAMALANHFDLPIYYLPLGDIEGDNELIGRVAEVKPRSVLLLEDIDVYHAATQRSESGTATMSALLNSLDGIWTPHGLITVLTTNNRDALDPALIRAGRVDYDDEFTLLDASQADRIVRWFTGEAPQNGIELRYNGKSPADLISALNAGER